MQLNRLKLAGMPVQKVSVNISAQRLREEGLIERLEALPILPGTLSFELLESTSFDGHDGELVPQIEKIRAWESISKSDTSAQAMPRSSRFSS